MRKKAIKNYRSKVVIKLSELKSHEDKKRKSNQIWVVADAEEEVDQFEKDDPLP